MLSRTCLVLRVMFAVALSPTLGLSAQTHRVTNAANVTRAVGVYEWTGELNKPTASRLVPVSLFIEGHLEDAGVYLARPVPFALSPGYVYAVEKAGEPLGTVDLSEARNIAARPVTENDNPLSAWFGYGRYIPPPAPPKPPALHTTARPGTIIASGGSSASSSRPHLSDRSGTESTPGKEGNAKTGAPEPTRDAATPRTEPPPKADPASSSTDDADRPHMSRRSDAPASTTTEPTSTPARPEDRAEDDDPERPTLRRRDAKAEPKRKKGSESGVRGMATSLNDDPDRPTLRRGSEDTPAATPPLSGNPPGLHQAVAVSDATTVDSHLFAREWESAAERASTLAAFQALARPRVANYLTVNRLKPGTKLLPVEATGPVGTSAGLEKASAGTGEDTGTPPRLQRGVPGKPMTSPTPATPKGQAAASPVARSVPQHTVRAKASHPAASASVPLLLQSEQVSAFTLSYGGVPTFVYTAITPTSEGVAVHSTLLAQQLPSGELQLSLSSITDDAHLDRTPWLRLVDAVDPNNSHRASFLFELRGKTSRQFALYSLITARAEQSFVTGLMQ